MNSTVKKYPSYKDSGVEWIGEIPEHWEVRRGKWLFKKQERTVRKEDEIVTCFRDGQVTLRVNRKTEGFTNAIKEHGYQGVRKGDLVIHNMDAFAGAIGVSDSDGKSTPVYSVCTPRLKQEVDPFYYAYFLRDLAKSGFIESLAKGIRERSSDFRFNDFGELLLSLPPKEEQTAIARFLDDKTALIDKAIAIKEQQIELLKERRQILIHRAVTRGLNPNVKFKDSGVKWIGEIPEHWEVKRLKFVFELIQTGTTPSTTNEAFFNGDLKWYNPKDLDKEILLESERRLSALAFLRGEIKMFPGDSVLIVGIGATSGKTSYLVEEGSFNQQITGFKSLENFNKFYFFLLRALANVMLGTANYTTLPILNNVYFKNLLLIQPPFIEQKAVVDSIEKTALIFEESISLKKKEIEKLKEYKASLINSAVTGKIKVC